MDKPKKPKDLGIVMETPELQAYTIQLEQLENRVILNKIQIEFDGEAIKLCKKRMKEERERFI